MSVLTRGYTPTVKDEDIKRVVILNVHPDEPVFHCMMHAGQSIFLSYTQRGRRIADYKPWLPRRHAAKFARPCKDCFPRPIETDGRTEQ